MLFFYYIELYGGTQVQLHKKLEKARTNHNTQWCGCVFYLRLCFFSHFTVFFLFPVVFSAMYCCVFFLFAVVFCTSGS